ncbi:hypothetical protein GGR54DRAFT_645358 [Hypoxylon sp. NC1633]|nr:hypothetical protein GGR54DRAFT_645358 [Hypoxylon sp. NC1633]
MVSVLRIVFAMLGVSAVYAARTLTSQCPSGQSLIANDRCCPGYAIITDKTVCCVTGIQSSRSLTGNCKAQVDITDSNYDQEISNALGGSSSNSASSSSDSAKPTGNAAIEANKATFVMVAAMAAVPVAFYGL